MRLCRLCAERPVAPARIRVHDYRCSRCRHNTPAMRAVNRRYFQSDLRRAVAKRSNAKRIFVGRQYHSAARTVDDAQRINAHIKDRRHAAIARLKDREKAESDPPGRVPAEAAI